MAHESTTERAALQHASASRARRSPKQATKQERARLLAVARAIYECFPALEDAGEHGDSNASGGRLLADAEGRMVSFLEAFGRSPLTNITVRDANNTLCDVQALLEGCQGVEVGKPRATLIGGVLVKLAQLKADLVSGKWPEESERDAMKRGFMAGKALAADMVEKAPQLLEEAMDAGNLDHALSLLAYYRGRGVPQHVFVLPYFERIENDPALRAGFMATLTEALSGEGRLWPSEIREATYLDCFGGPDGRYLAEEPEGSAGLARPTQVLAGVPREQQALSDGPSEEEGGLGSDSLSEEFSEDARAFMAGKGLAADMLERGQILGSSTTDHTAHLEAYYRGRGVPQDVFVRPYFDKIENEPALREGFMAALSEIMVNGEGANAEHMREATYLDCVGGPETEYMSEEGVEPVSEGTTSTVAVNVEPPPRGNLRILWQLAMDEITNTSVHDAAEGIDKVISLLVAMRPLLPSEDNRGLPLGDAAPIAFPPGSQATGRIERLPGQSREINELIDRSERRYG
jgi:hypothetical protein